MNHKKRIGIITIIGIILLLLIITTILLAKNKTNWVSDQDFLYAKAIDYIVSKQKKNGYDNNKEDYQVFADYKGFGISKNDKNNEKYVYMYILEECYYVKNEKIRSSEGSCIPYKFTFDENNEVINYETPKDGGEYVKSLKRIFPNEIQDKVLAYTFDNTKLRNKVKEHYSYLASTEIVAIDDEENPIVICGTYGGYTSKAEANTIEGNYIDGYGNVYKYKIPCDEKEELLVGIDELNIEIVMKYTGEKVATISKEEINEIKNNLRDIEEEYEEKGIWVEDIPLSFVKVKYIKKDDLTVAENNKGELIDLIKITNEINISEAGNKIINILKRYHLVYTYNE